MKIVAPGVEQRVADQTDIFKRRPFAQGLLRLFKESDDPLVVALDEPWGSGKTVFVRRLAEAAKADPNLRVIYFDAFKNDFDPDVFVAISSEIIREFGPVPKADAKFSDRARSVAKIVGRAGLKSAVRALSVGLVQLGDLSEVAKEIGSDVGDQIEGELDKIIDERLAGSQAQVRAFDAFRDSLVRITRERKIVFVIDELDRCKPTYALSVIETIKHFFSAPGVHFLLVCQMSQLEASAKQAYGESLDAHTYLERFISARVHFPVLRGGHLRTAVTAFVADVMGYMPDDGQKGELTRGMIDFMSEIAVRNGYTLRRIEQVATQFGMCMAFTGTDRERLAPALHVLCDLKLNRPDLFAEAKRGRLTFEQIMGHYNFDETFSWYIGWLKYIFDGSFDIRSQEAREYSRHFGVGDDRSEVIMYLTNDVVDALSVQLDS